MEKEEGTTGFGEKKIELKVVKQSTNLIDNEDIEALRLQQGVQFLDIPDDQEEEVAKPNSAEKETVESSWEIGVQNELQVANPSDGGKETIESWKIGVKNKIDEEDAISRWNVNSSFMKLVISKNPIYEKIDDQEGEVGDAKRKSVVQEPAVIESEAAKRQKDADDSKNSKEIGGSSSDQETTGSLKNSDEIGGSSSDQSSTESSKEIGGSSSDESSTGSSKNSEEIGGSSSDQSSTRSLKCSEEIGESSIGSLKCSEEIGGSSSDQSSTGSC